MLNALLDFLLRRKTAGGLEKRHESAVETLKVLQADAHVAHEATMHAIEELAARAKRIADVRSKAARHADLPAAPEESK